MKLNTLRPRRLRLNSAVRDMVRENSLSVKDLIYPIFVVAGENVKEEIPSMPDVYHLSVDNAVKSGKRSFMNLEFQRLKFLVFLNIKMK